MRKAVKRSFRKDESGAATVELVLWTPLFVLILAFVLDTSITLLSHSLLWDVSRDTTRQIALGRMNATQAVAHAQSAAVVRSATPIVTASDVGPDVWVKIEMPVSEIVIFNFFDFVLSDRISAKAVMVREPS